MILLREKRMKRGLSQKKLADLSGVPQQSISAYESEARIPGVDSLHALATVLGCTMDELYRPDGGPDRDGRLNVENKPDGEAKGENKNGEVA